MSATNTNSPQSYGIAGQHGVNIQVGGVSVPIFPQDGIHLLETQNVGQHLPVIMVKLLDCYGLYQSSVPINDGTQFQVAFNDGNSGLPAMVNYRAFGTPARKKHSSGYNELTVIGLLDNISYIRETVNRGMVGSSTNVMQQIASLLNMQYITNDSSNDAMTWLPGRGTFTKFATNIAKHAYSDEQSVFSHGVTTSNTLMFINLQKLFSGKTFKATFFHGCVVKDSTEPTYEIFDKEAVNDSGLFNHIYGYGMRQSQTSGTGEANIYTTVQATYTKGANLDINQDSAQSLANRTRIQIAPMNCGNSHANYILAKHQNARLKATYSQRFLVVIHQDVGLNLYDIVRTKVYNNGVIDLTTSGTYCVTGIARGIKGLQFFVKYELTTTGPSNDNPALY